MVFQPIFHRECLGKGLLVVRDKPIAIILDFAVIVILDVDEVAENLHHKVCRQAVKIALRGVFDPVTFPIVVDARLDDLILMINAFCKKPLHTFEFGERHMRSIIEDKTIVFVRSCVPTVVWLLFVHNRADTFAVKSVCCPESRHTCA